MLVNKCYQWLSTDPCSHVWTRFSSQRLGGGYFDIKPRAGQALSYAEAIVPRRRLFWNQITVWELYSRPVTCLNKGVFVFAELICLEKRCPGICQLGPDGGDSGGGCGDIDDGDGDDKLSHHLKKVIYVMLNKGSSKR